MPLYRAVTEYRVTCEVEVEARNFTEAMELIQDEDDSVVEISENFGDLEILNGSVYEVKP